MFICSCVQYSVCVHVSTLCLALLRGTTKKFTHLNFSFTPFTITPFALVHKSSEPFYPLNDIQKIITLFFKDLASHSILLWQQHSPALILSLLGTNKEMTAAGQKDRNREI